MLEHTDNFSIRKIKIAEILETSLKLLKSSSSQLAKEWAISTPQTIQSFENLLDGPNPM